MIVRYRLVEKDWEWDNPDRTLWAPWGVVYENCSGRFEDSKVLIHSIPDEYKGIVRSFEDRVAELQLDLKNADLMLGQYAHRFHLRPEIETVEGETYKEIRQRLWDRIFAEGEMAGEPRGLRCPESIEGREEYAIAETRHPIREDNAEDLHPPLKNKKLTKPDVAPEGGEGRER
jgi:hypothetical protein